MCSNSSYTSECVCQTCKMQRLYTNRDFSPFILPRLRTDLKGQTHKVFFEHTHCKSSSCAMTGASSAFHPLNQLVLSVNHTESFAYQQSRRLVQVPPLDQSQPIRARWWRSLQRLYKQGLKHVVFFRRRANCKILSTIFTVKAMDTMKDECVMQFNVLPLTALKQLIHDMSFPRE